MSEILVMRRTIVADLCFVDVLCSSGVAVVCLGYICCFVEETSHIKMTPTKITDDQEPLFADKEQVASEEEIRQQTDL